MLVHIFLSARQMSYNILVTWGANEQLHFPLKWRSYDPYLTMRIWFHLTLSMLNSLDIFLWLEAQPQDTQFSAYFSLLDHRASCNSSEISGTIWWMQSDQLRKCFWFGFLRRLLNAKSKHLGWCNGEQTRLANLHKLVWVSLGAWLIWPSSTSKQKAYKNYYLMPNLPL